MQPSRLLPSEPPNAALSTAILESPAGILGVYRPRDESRNKDCKTERDINSALNFLKNDNYALWQGLSNTLRYRQI